MSNFNTPVPNASRSAISLGGEWRNRDQMEANKYKMSGLTVLNKKKAGKAAAKEKSRPRSTPTAEIQECEEGEVPKSAPPGGRQRCGRVNEVESPEPTARKTLENHLPLKKFGSAGKPDESGKQFDLGPGMTMTKSRSKVAVTINTGGGDTPPPIIRRYAEPTQSVGDPAKPQLLANLRGPINSGHSKHWSDRSSSGFGSNSLLGSSSLLPPHTTSPHTSPTLDRKLETIPAGVTFMARSSSPSIAMSAQDALIAQLQQQVSDLTLYLEEERLNHKTSKEKAGNLLREKLKELDRKHTEKFQKYKQDQEEQVAMLKEVQTKEINHIKSGSEKALARMKGELEFLQGAFEAYKRTLTQDMVEKWTKKESDMKMKFHEDMEKELSEQRAELLEEKNIERNALNREFQKQMHILSQEHKGEIEKLMKRFAGAAMDVENLRKALEQIKSLRAELNNALEALEISKEEAASFKGRLTEAKMMLIDYQENFSGKVDEVDGKYKEKIHLLMTENAELRKRYMQKCNELFNEKSKTEYNRVEKVMNTKEMMKMLVHVRNRSNVSLACSDPAADAKPRLLVTRPVSAPSTRKEAHKAHRMAGETDHLSSPTPQRPHTTMLATRPAPPRENLGLINAFGSAHSLQSL
ncbi:paramyosin-like isoform X2 [Lytechinus pictus]|uniref:paramyosin-like isoform X2 n=1 Tax=Lytechinus pictus TaxID=7653 RepID=UPI0030B9D6C2